MNFLPWLFRIKVFIAEANSLKYHFNRLFKMTFFYQYTNFRYNYLESSDNFNIDGT